MEDKKMTEKESLELITQMIQNSKKNLRLGNVNILLLWGYLCTITALVVYVLILITGNPLWNWLWLAIPVIGFPVMHWLKKKEDKPVLTYTDKVLLAIWSNIGQYGIGISIISALYFDSMLLLLPIILLLCSLEMLLVVHWQYPWL